MTTPDRKKNVSDMRKDREHHDPYLRRKSDGSWYINSRENWYRDLWLLLITIVCAISVWKALSVASTARHLSKQSTVLSQEIQRQRISTLLSECQAQNSRNRNTINYLDHLGANVIKKHPSQAHTVHIQLGQDDLLIDALAPHQNCKMIVKNYTGKN